MGDSEENIVVDIVIHTSLKFTQFVTLTPAKILYGSQYGYSLNVSNKVHKTLPEATFIEPCQTKQMLNQTMVHLELVLLQAPTHPPFWW